jgi:prepilin-type N-terminal cleavage/methylation domain-containing protein
MDRRAKRFLHRAGFTLVEVLAAVAIIAILISLIIPALSMVQRSADMAKQRAQFHSIEIAIEAFRADFGDYPRSVDTGLMVQAYPGAMKLAEAVIGQDGFGFHPGSEFTNDGQADWYGNDGFPEPLYLPDVEGYIDSLPLLTNDEKNALKKENLTMRKGPYLELETANAVKIRDIYSDLGIDGLQLVSVRDRFVLCDMFGLVKNNATGKRTGMPILYYRANTSNFKHDPADYSAQPDENIYDYRDNQKIIDLTVLWERTVLNPMRSNNTELDGPSLFYKETLNPNFATPPMRPYRADSFILLSAGPDGEYGTADDVFNFNKEQ